MTRADDIRVVNRVALGALALIAMAVVQHCADAPKAGAREAGDVDLSRLQSRVRREQRLLLRTSTVPQVWAGASNALAQEDFGGAVATATGEDGHPRNAQVTADEGQGCRDRLKVKVAPCPAGEEKPGVQDSSAREAAQPRDSSGTVAGHGRDDRHLFARSADHATVALTGGERPAHVIVAAQICVLEAMWRTTDCAGILLTASRRAHARLGSEPWLTALVSYSAPAMRLGKRRVKAAISAEPERFVALQEFVASVLSGDVPDPCPRAWHFGSIEDGSRGRMTSARCSGPTANRFFALGPRAVLPARVAAQR